MGKFLLSTTINHIQGDHKDFGSSSCIFFLFFFCSEVRNHFFCCFCFCVCFRFYSTSGKSTCTSRSNFSIAVAVVVVVVVGGVGNFVGIVF